jgi:glutathione synthase/RimK-type ligase-like ATP-grasp enzyme
MKHILFLSCQSLTGFITDDNLAVKELQTHGFQVSTLPWDQEADWKQFDLVIIRTTWDYTQRPQEFLEKMKLIASQTKLVNSYEVVKWNYHKGYLGELQKQAVKIVPTVFFSYPANISLPSDWNFSQYILKPCISASAHKTMIVSEQDIKNNAYQKDLHAGDWMLQPFLEEIKQGEISLHYFNKTFSHAILKVPKSGDFRVQEEHGGDIQSFVPDQKILQEAQALLTLLPFDLLYARVDFVPYQGQYLLMELELIEPALYFRTSADSVVNFCQAITDLCGN